MRALLGLLLFLLNAYFARDLFHAEFTRQLGSIESSFIALAGYAMRNWGDLTWLPFWFGGMPFHNVYQPGFHLTVAGLGTALHWTPQHAYHFVTAVTYAIAPVTLFWFCYRMTGSAGYGFAVGLFYSLVSSSALLSRTVWMEVGGPFHPRRFQTLVAYGESPHILATAILPVVLLCVYRAAVDRKAVYFPLASATLACLVLTNWPGTVGLALAMLAFCLSEIGEKRLSWTRLAGIGALSYLLACRWIPPSTLLLVPRNAQQSDYSYFHASHLLYAAALAAFAVFAHFGLRRLGAGAFLRFGVYFTLLTALMTLGRFWFGWNLFPQAHRFQIEMEMAIAITVCYLCKLVHAQLPRPAQLTVIAALIVSALGLIPTERRYTRALSAPMDMAATSEFRVAHALASLRPNDRVFAPGNISYWMNLWTDTPQVSGCCDQGIPDYEHRISDYTVYTGMNAGSRDAAVSLAWLRAYGATAVVVDGPRSTDPYHPFRNPHKFEGVLPVLWRDGDDVIYDIPARARSLAHVIPRSALITRAPENGLVTAELERYNAAVEDPAMPLAAFRWTSRHSAHVTAAVTPGQLLNLQISFDPGWRAQVAGVGRPVLRDKIGQMNVETGCNGPCEVELVYDGGMEARVMAVLQALGVLVALSAPYLLRRVAANREVRTNPANNKTFDPGSGAEA